MLGTILKLFRPSYALTALILFGGWQGYSFVKSVPERLHSPLGVEEVKTEGQTKNEQVKKSQSEQSPSSPVVAAVEKINPAVRIVYWLIFYALLCFATVPLIRRILVLESNFANVALILVYPFIGFMLACGLMAFYFGWLNIVMLILAVMISSGLIIWLAGELEKMRVEDTLSSS